MTRSFQFHAKLLRGITLATTALAAPQTSSNNTDLLAARKARDAADVASLQQAVSAARQQAQQQNTADAYEQVAVLNSWLCEAGHAKNENKLIKKAAEDGVAAANKALELNANSSPAHCLKSELLGQLIPHVTAGGVRLGPESTRQADRAIELDPKNADAYVARALDYFYTPRPFGGNKEKAVEFLQQAIRLDPASDTAHLYLAQVYLETNRLSDALREIDEALRLDPDRSFAQSVRYQIVAATKH